MPRRIPFRVAAGLALTGEPLAAQLGYSFGLVNRLTQPRGAPATALELAAAIAANAPLAVLATRSIVAGGADWPAREFWDRQRSLIEPVFRSADALEGARPFAEKRPARWGRRQAR